MPPCRRIARPDPTKTKEQLCLNSLSAESCEGQPSPGHVSRNRRLTRKPTGVVVDWVGTVGSSVTTLSSSTNWLISSSVTYNSALTIEGGTILKYKAGTAITANSTLTLKSSQYRPIVFTCV